ncbi:MAG: hypothetical protein NTV52_23190 [Acidobacteria bacterium]|nr:hypothetical protein [Acidobacteriota bacterium]
MAQTDLVGFNPEANLRLDAKAEAVVFTSDGTKVVLATRTGAFLGDAQSGSLRPFATGSMRPVAISRDDKRMAAGGMRVRLWWRRRGEHRCRNRSWSAGVACQQP